MHRHARSNPNLKKPNTKAAAQRLAQVMSNQSGGGGGDESDEEEDLDLYDYNPSNVSSIGLGGGGRAARPRSPMVCNHLLSIHVDYYVAYDKWHNDE